MLSLRTVTPSTESFLDLSLLMKIFHRRQNAIGNTGHFPDDFGAGECGTDCAGFSVLD
jgi:hypothetical protein